MHSIAKVAWIAPTRVRFWIRNQPSQTISQLYYRVLYITEYVDRQSLGLAMTAKSPYLALKLNSAESF